jgi:hypothetical protein
MIKTNQHEWIFLKAVDRRRKKKNGKWVLRGRVMSAQIDRKGA